MLLLTDLRIVACTMLIQIFKSIHKVPKLLYKPINQHEFSFFKCFKLAAFNETQNINTGHFIVINSCVMSYT